MHPILRYLAVALAASCVLLAGCGNKHAPVKPTVAASSAH